MFCKILHQKDASLVVVASATVHGWSVLSVFCSGILTFFNLIFLFVTMPLCKVVIRYCIQMALSSHYYFERKYFHFIVITISGLQTKEYWKCFLRRYHWWSYNVHLISPTAQEKGTLSLFMPYNVLTFNFRLDHKFLLLCHFTLTLKRTGTSRNRFCVKVLWQYIIWS